MILFVWQPRKSKELQSFILQKWLQITKIIYLRKKFPKILNQIKMY